MEQNHIPQLDLTLEKVTGSRNADYTDNDMAFFSDIRRIKEKAARISADFTMLLFCLKGAIEIDLDAARHRVGKNECLFSPPHTRLNTSMISLDFRGALICISPRLLADSLYNGTDIVEKFFYLGHNPVIALDDERMLNCYHYNEILQRKSKEPACPYKQEIIRSLLRATIYELLSALDRRIPQRAEASHALGQGEILVYKFLRMLMADKVKARFVTDYASRLCVTPKYLSAMCKKTTGKTASAWIDEFVVKEARHLMLHSGKSIKEISQELGFPNLSFFGKYIKAQLGMSPTAYRRTYRKQEDGNATS